MLIKEIFIKIRPTAIKRLFNVTIYKKKKKKKEENKTKQNKTKQTNKQTNPNKKSSIHSYIYFLKKLASTVSTYLRGVKTDDMVTVNMNLKSELDQ